MVTQRATKYGKILRQGFVRRSVAEERRVDFGQSAQWRLLAHEDWFRLSKGKLGGSLQLVAQLVRTFLRYFQTVGKCGPGELVALCKPADNERK
jgi:hypothetical protein